MLAPPLKCPSQGVKGDGTCEELIRKEAGRPGHKTVSSSTSLRERVVLLVSTLTASKFSQTSESIVAGSRVRELSVVAWPTRASARSLPRTLECPGQKIHRTLCKLLWLIAVSSQH